MHVATTERCAVYSARATRDEGARRAHTGHIERSEECGYQRRHHYRSSPRPADIFDAALVSFIACRRRAILDTSCGS